MNTFDIHKNFIAVLGALALSLVLATAHPADADGLTAQNGGTDASSIAPQPQKSFVRSINELLGVKTPENDTGTSHS